jgi:hypothetical protein
MYLGIGYLTSRVNYTYVCMYLGIGYLTSRVNYLPTILTKCRLYQTQFYTYLLDFLTNMRDFFTNLWKIDPTKFVQIFCKSRLVYFTSILQNSRIKNVVKTCPARKYWSKSYKYVNGAKLQIFVSFGRTGSWTFSWRN